MYSVGLDFWTASASVSHGCLDFTPFERSDRILYRNFQMVLSSPDVPLPRYIHTYVLSLIARLDVPEIVLQANAWYSQCIQLHKSKRAGICMLMLPDGSACFPCADYPNIL